MTSSNSNPTTSPFWLSSTTKLPSFGDSSSKKAKASKTKGIENPFLKSPHFTDFGVRAKTPNVTPRNQQSSYPSRSPLTPLDGISQPPATMKSAMKMTAQPATPGPPPTMSLSLMESAVMPMQMDAPTPKSNDVSERSTFPQPIVSPPFSISAAGQARTEGLFDISGSAEGTGNWIVGFGFDSTSMDQFQELFEILSTCGTIEQHISGGNWVAIQYISRFSVEKAMSCQPFYSSKNNVYYGISRVTLDRVRILQQRKSKMDVMSEMSKKALTSTIADNGGTLNEKDLFVIDESTSKQNTGRPKKPESICQWLLSMYFNWVYETQSDHPHSD